MHYVVDDVSSTGTLCVWWMAWRAPDTLCHELLVNDMASTGTLCIWPHQNHSLGRVQCAERQGLTLVHFSAQLKRILWDRGAHKDCRGGV
jgi:hypothetical protein